MEVLNEGVDRVAGSIDHDFIGCAKSHVDVLDWSTVGDLVTSVGVDEGAVDIENHGARGHNRDSIELNVHGKSVRDGNEPILGKDQALEGIINTDRDIGVHHASDLVNDGGLKASYEEVSNFGDAASAKVNRELASVEGNVEVGDLDSR